MKNYIVIGGSSGIGEQIVQLLEAQQNNVIATYNSTEQSSRANVTYHHLDVTTGSLDLDQLPEEIHGLAYCPGTINLKPFHRFKPEDFLEDYKIQVVGATSIIQQLLSRMKKSEGASIVLFSTVAVQMGFNFHSQVSASKGAIEGLTRALSAELAPTIRINTIAPSLTQTKLAGRLLNSPEKVEHHANVNPLKKVGNPKDVAEAAVFLLTDKSSWITGQIIHVDGGFSAIK